ncbi:putative CD2 antigen cytoplasmic tail-binding protein 2 [Neospora caninum Liverpool]|uniref:CD2 antigen cytoplasmic tail-binding protein 2,putative n=1 Tax=Neospora caninum (strain Liverpool) TaxID=572307 RepID=F0VP59_NEOCL|nr:putative CD2 antigen cytoplasmic tail-binding protein 2 [Neospora caninum Liverpool]CBZ55505.1 putative CD2 antigen cytoplasmic tail-binding protein 2 [Neospora caninum Liverpool]CEL70243.1 TPA: CD2 antigen cytoplasmic tail-binding protein 2,putative [Neospora caninum Liverpool]|eukprot:XP_003885533.1 putative CD2 antigen cytoplasmic tail-binding protein 2 [Neospora caninum Liverpool]
MERPNRENPPEGAMPPPKRVCFKQEKDVKLVEKWDQEEIFSPPEGNEDDTSGDLDSQYSKDEVEKIRRRKKVLAAGVGSLGYSVGDTDVDTVNTRSAAVAASEADPEVEKDEKGVVFEPFNMRRELQEGTFDEEGNYIWRAKQPSVIADGWLDAIDSGDANTAFRTEEARQRVLSEMRAEPEATVVDVTASLAALAELLDCGESATEAMRRIKAGASRRAAGEVAADGGEERSAGSRERQNKRRRREEEEEDEAFCRPTAKRTRRKKREEDAGHEEHEETQPEGEDKEGPNEKELKEKELKENEEKGGASAPSDETETQRERENKGGSGRNTARLSGKRKDAKKGKMNEDELRVFNAITDLCSNLMTVGKNVYFLRKEDILKELKERESEKTATGASEERSEASQADDAAAEGTTYWQFRWVNNPNDTEVHGPYPASLLQAWIQQGFVSDATAMQVRQVSAANEPLDGVWLLWKEADFRSSQEQEDDERLREAEEDERQREAESDEERAREKERRRKEAKERGEEEEEDEDKDFRKNERVMRMLETST